MSELDLGFQNVFIKTSCTDMLLFLHNYTTLTLKMTPVCESYLEKM